MTSLIFSQNSQSETLKLSANSQWIFNVCYIKDELPSLFDTNSFLLQPKKAAYVNYKVLMENKKKEQLLEVERKEQVREKTFL